MLAPERFAAWLDQNTHVDQKLGHTYLYHPRSDVHSVALCQFIRDDLINSCPLLAGQAAIGNAAYGINVLVGFSSGKVKKLDLAIGVPPEPLLPPAGVAIARTKHIERLLIACEAKAVMTEHVKAKPRVYDELSSSHEIVHQGQPDAIAAGICVINVSTEFVSPLRQISAHDLVVTRHSQPRVTQSIIDHLRGLPMREKPGQVGFDAFATIVVETDNRRGARLVTDAPAPLPTDPHHYATFLTRIAHLYDLRFGNQ